MKKALILAGVSALLLTGCSLSNPFGIGHDKSVSETAKTKTFGVSGSPRNIHKYRDSLRKVQDDYMRSDIDYELYFAINDDGEILVKHDREDEFENYELSEWKDRIDKALKKKEMQTEKIRAKREERARKEAEEAGKTLGTKSASFQSRYNDLAVTKENDLSIVYKEQAPMVSSRTKVGNIIRDNGRIQQVFVANYVNNEGDLVASHDLYVVVKEPEWVVGENTPKNTSNIGEIPTPISKSMIEQQNYTSKKEEAIVNSYINDDPAAVTNAINMESEEELRDKAVIQEFLSKSKKNKGK
ncbi:TraV family lipoprotein [Campylobacter sp. MOP7]|uniref:TraV family lipoprotein n=1 Tax=Campylobacter canis TaxID=3378588 RepID=UPI00387EA8B7